MNKIINKLINHFLEKPKTLFLVDGVGAILTAFVLFVIMRQLNEYFGMHKTVLTCLSVIACFFCIYSATCFLFLKSRWTLFINIIGISNLLYCFLTMGLLIKYHALLTTIGVIYFIAEIAIICALGYIEIKVAKEIKKKGLFDN